MYLLCCNLSEVLIVSGGILLQLPAISASPDFVDKSRNRRDSGPSIIFRPARNRHNEKAAQEKGRRYLDEGAPVEDRHFGIIMFWEFGRNPLRPEISRIFPA